jgi:hypothetical protein
MSTTTTRMALATCLAGVCLAGSVLTGCSSSSGPAETQDAGGKDAPSGSDAKSSGGAPLCTSSGKNAYETYGMAAFLTVDAAIFTNVGTELNKNGPKNLGDSFSLIGKGQPASTKDDAAVFQAKLGAFLVAAYGGPSSIMVDGTSYSGNIDLVTAHTGLKITSDQYSYFVMSIVVPALTGSGVKSEDVMSCFAPVVLASAVEDAVVGH